MKYSEVNYQRRLDTIKTTGITGNFTYSEADCLSFLDTSETTGDCRDNWGLKIQGVDY